MVRAINKHGREQYFTERVWNLMPKHKNGWVEFDQQGELLVPQQIIEFQQMKKEAVVVDAVTNETQIEEPVIDPTTEAEETDSHKVDIKNKPGRKPKNPQ
jgi:hypothetical protein